jgi:uncharacterized protein (TIGR00730 family)
VRGCEHVDFLAGSNLECVSVLVEERMRYCVFSGSSTGVRAEYAEAARGLGQLFVREGIGLVYGGASVGLMGAISDAVIDAGGEAIGVIPRDLVEKELASTRLRDLRVTSSMHERKAMMAELSDGFIALPGGIGTFEEMFEIWTWAQLGYHAKPIGMLNVAGFYDGLAAFLDRVVDEGFLKAKQRGMMLCESEPEKLLRAMSEYVPPIADKWIGLKSAT